MIYAEDTRLTCHPTHYTWPTLLGAVGAPALVSVCNRARRAWDQGGAHTRWYMVISRLLGAGSVGVGDIPDIRKCLALVAPLSAPLSLQEESWLMQAVAPFCCKHSTVPFVVCSGHS